MSPPASASHAFARAGALREEYAVTDWAAVRPGTGQVVAFMTPGEVME